MAIAKSNGGAAAVGPASAQKVSVGRQVLRRELNDRLWARHNGSEAELEVYCECGRAGCRDAARVTPVFYERLRRVPTHFLVKGDHAEVGERVVESHGDFVIVEKFGPGGLEAIQLERAKHHLPSGRSE
jgi:hypothetical protein